MVAVCTARRIARSIASSVCKSQWLHRLLLLPTDIDQLLLDGTNAAHYTTAEWAGFEHLLKDQKQMLERFPGSTWATMLHAPDGIDDYICSRFSNWF